LRLVLAVATAVAAVGALGACGGASDDSTEARRTAVAWLSALAESDGRGACALLAPALAAQAEPSCEAIYGGYGEVLGETLGAAGLSFDDVVGDDGAALHVSVDGERATVALPGEVFRPLELRLTDKGWRVARGLRAAP
jgi:hypothetical protein